MSTDSLTVSQNHWRVPSVERAFDGWLEGSPSEAEKLLVIAKAEADRAAWTPSTEAMALVERLKNFIGSRVQIQFWDSIMFCLEEEGPFPLFAICRGVILLRDGEFQQAYLELSDAVEQPNSEGYSPMSYLQRRADSVFDLAPLADLYQITKI